MRRLLPEGVPAAVGVAVGVADGGKAAQGGGHSAANADAVGSPATHVPAYETEHESDGGGGVSCDDYALSYLETCTVLPMTLSEGELESVKMTSSAEPSSTMVTSSQRTFLLRFSRISKKNMYRKVTEACKERQKEKNEQKPTKPRSVKDVLGGLGRGCPWERGRGVREKTNTKVNFISVGGSDQQEQEGWRKNIHPHN